MRTVGVLLILIALGRAEDLRPRTGSGWNGFQAGTWVRMKRTAIPMGKPPMVTIWKQTLQKADKKKLTLETVSKNALGIEHRDRQELPSSGEAGPGEEQEVKKLKNAPVLVGGKKLDCARVRTTVTGPQGKRVIATWVADKPMILAKRTVTQHDAAGKLVYSTTWLLSDPRATKKIGAKTIPCVKYKTRMRHANGMGERGVAYTSRQVPGSTVWVESETIKGDRVVLSLRVELLDYKAK